MLYILLSHKTGWDNDICSNMNGPTDYQTKSSKSDKDKCHMISLICVIFKKWHKRTYLQNGNRLTDIENTFKVTKRESKGSGDEEIS